MSKPLSLPQIKKKLEKMFKFTSDLALGKSGDFVEDTRIAAAQASAQIAEVLMEIHEQILAEALFGPANSDPDGYDHSTDSGEDGFDSEPE